MTENNETRKMVIGFIIGEIICSLISFAVFSFIIGFDIKVILGTLIGLLSSVINFVLMVRGLERIADSKEEPAVAEKKNKVSFLGRTFLLGIILALVVVTDFFNPIAVVIPLLCTKPILLLQQFIRKSGDEK